MVSRKSLFLVGVFGISGVALYVGATVLGGLLDPHYSHIRNAISELTGSKAPNKVALAPIYIAYNLALVGFSVAVFRASSRSPLFRVAIALFAVAALSGIGQVTFFRQDSVGAPATAQGSFHLVLAGLSSVLTLAAAVLYGFAFRRDATWKKLSTLCFVAAGAVLVTAPGAAFSIGSAYMGLFERITIGCFLAWVVLVSIYSVAQAGQIEGYPKTKYVPIMRPSKSGT